MPQRPQRPGRTIQPAPGSRRASVGLGAFMPAGGGGVEQDPKALADYSSTVDPSVDTYDARNMSFFKPKNGFTDFISGGKASDYANKLNTQSILQDQSQRQGLQNRIAEINASHAATLADQEREEGDLGRNWASYASANNLSLPPGSAPLSAKGLGSLYGSTYGAKTPFIEGFNKEKLYRNENTNKDIEAGVQSTPEYQAQFGDAFINKLNAGSNEDLLRGLKARSDVNQLTQNLVPDLEASGTQAKINAARATNTLNNLPAENVANLSTLKARPYLNAAAVLAGQEGPKFGNYSINYDLSKGGAPMLYKFPSERETLAAPLTGKTPGVTVEPFNPGSGVSITNPETGKTVNLKRSVSNPAIDSILSPLTALQRAREPFNGDDTTLEQETQRNPVNTGSPLTNPYTLEAPNNQLDIEQVEQSQPSSKVPVKISTVGISPLSWTEWPGILQSEYSRVLKALKQNSRAQ